jgi:hypothetical protein
MVAIHLFLLLVELRLFSYRLKFMYLNGVAVEVKWEILKFSPIHFVYFFFQWRLEMGLHWFNYIDYSMGV